MCVSLKFTLIYYIIIVIYIYFSIFANNRKTEGCIHPPMIHY